MKQLPEKAIEREVIIIVDSYIKASDYYKKIIGIDNVCILDYPYEENEVSKSISKKRAKPGDVFVLNPYNHKQYIRFDDIFTDLPVLKFQTFSLLCQYLGAKEVKITQLKFNEENITDKIKLDIKNKMIDNKTEFELKRIKDIYNEISMCNKFEGSEPDVKEALIFLEENNLEEDFVLSALCKSRQIQNNKINTYSLSLNLTKELNTTLNIMNNFDKSVLSVKLFKINANYEKEITSKSEISVVIEVHF